MSDEDVDEYMAWEKHNILQALVRLAKLDWLIYLTLFKSSTLPAGATWKELTIVRRRLQRHVIRLINFQAAEIARLRVEVASLRDVC
jgi:hypothetical protein